jgi:hypothetical protein
MASSFDVAQRIVQAAEEALRNTPTKVTAEGAVLGGRGPYGSPSPW